MSISNIKIENKALNALENIIDENPLMNYSFNSCDKEMSWDGYIWIFESEALDKKSYDDKIPVQIKGHIDKNRKFINKQKILYKVSLDDLNIYFKDRGVLYFQIFISEDGKRNEIFYSSLYPSKIKHYLNKAKKRKNKATINIDFKKFKKHSKEIYILSKQFSQESRKQGFGTGYVVQNTINIKDIDTISLITATAVGASNEYEFLQRACSGDVCFYVTKDENSINLPIEYSETLKLAITKEITNNICIDNKIYYNKYKIVTNDNGEQTLILSENLKMNLKDKKIIFREEGTINSLKNDAEFLIEMINKDLITIGGNNIQSFKSKMHEEIKNRLNFYIELYDVLQMIGFDYLKPFKDLCQKSRDAFEELVLIKRGKKNSFLKSKITAYNWKIEDKYVPIFIKRHKEDEENELINGIYNDREIIITDKDNQKYVVPMIYHIDYNTLANLFYYDYKILYKQIDNEILNKNTIPYLNNIALTLIKSYDLSKNSKLLDLALYQLNKIDSISDINEDYYKLNIIQIKKRIGDLSNDDIKYLLELKEESNELDIKCCINILLENKEESIKIYNQMDSNDKDIFLKLPIYHLYENLTS